MGFSFVIGVLAVMLSYALGLSLGVLMALNKDKLIGPQRPRPCSPCKRCPAGWWPGSDGYRGTGAYMYTKWEEFGYLDYVTYSEWLNALARNGETHSPARQVMIDL